jgi:hypothetical protein
VKFKRLALATAACGLLAGAVATATSSTGTAAPARQAAACESTQLTLYPGALTSLRYGEWNMNVLACPTKSPASWKKDSRIELNATASNVGLTVAEDSKLRITETGQNKWNRFARYEATFQSRSCLAKVGWPCKSPRTWTARFTVTADKKSHEVKIYKHGSGTSDPTFALWSTP